MGAVVLNVSAQKDGVARHAYPMTLYLEDSLGGTGSDNKLTSPGITIDEACSLVLTSPGAHQLGIILDGNPQIVLIVVDGMLCDGGSSQLRGWQWLWPRLNGDLGANVEGVYIGGATPASLFATSDDSLSANRYDGKLLGARVYSRALKVSEMVRNAEAGPPVVVDGVAKPSG